MIKGILKHWNGIRFLKLGIGAFAFVSGIQEREWPLILLGALFILMTVLNRQICPFSTCTVKRKESGQSVDDVRWEEVQIDKPAVSQGNSLSRNK